MEPHFTTSHAESDHKTFSRFGGGRYHGVFVHTLYQPDHAASDGLYSCLSSPPGCDDDLLLAAGVVESSGQYPVLRYPHPPPIGSLTLGGVGLVGQVQSLIQLIKRLLPISQDM